MNLLAPPELQKIAPLLTAGEDVLWVGKPSLSVLSIYGVAIVGAGLVVLLAIMSVFSDLPIHLKASISLIFAILLAGVIYVWAAARTYVVTDKRILIVNDMGNSVSEAADAEEIQSISRGGFGNPLVLHRTHGRPIRFFALSDMTDAENAVKRLGRSQ